MPREIIPRQLAAKREDGTYSYFDIVKGAKGDTPVKGADYWTEADKAEIVADVASPIVGGDVWTPRTYVSGEFCIHNNKVWECVADTTNEPTDADTTHWKVVSLKSINNLYDGLIEREVRTVSHSNGYVNLGAYGSKILLSATSDSTNGIGADIARSGTQWLVYLNLWGGRMTGSGDISLRLIWLNKSIY